MTFADKTSNIVSINTGTVKPINNEHYNIYVQKGI